MRVRTWAIATAAVLSMALLGCDGGGGSTIEVTFGKVLPILARSRTVIALEEQGTLAKYGVELIGASVDAIKLAEDRLLFRDAMREIGADVPRSIYCRSLDEALVAVEDIGFPAIIRPSFTMGGVGGGIAYNIEEFRELAARCVVSNLNPKLLYQHLVEPQHLDEDTRERIAPPPQQKTNVMQDVRDLSRNGPWVVLFFLALIIMVTITLRTTTAA